MRKGLVVSIRAVQVWSAVLIFLAFIDIGVLADALFDL